MTTFPNSPRLLKGGIVLIDPETSAVQRIIALQYNPDTLSRTLQLQAVEGRRRPIGGDAADRAAGGDDQARRRDRRDRSAGVSRSESDGDAVRHSAAAGGAGDDRLSDEQPALVEQRAGAVGHAGDRADGSRRSRCSSGARASIVPVRITDFSITEEAFDPALNPIRAKVSLGMRVLSVTDLGFDHKGGSLFMGYQQQKEQLAAKSQGGALGALGNSRDLHERSDPSACNDAAAGRVADRRSFRPPAATTASNSEA